MLKTVVSEPAMRDVANMLYELGIADSPLEPLDPDTTLRDGLDLDSQEIVSLLELASSLATSCAPLNEDAVETVNDIVLHLSAHRDPWLPDRVPFVMQGTIVIKQTLDTVFEYIADHRQWVGIVPRVISIEPEFDTERIQVFKMQTEAWDTGAPSLLHTCRYVSEPSGVIDFALLSPPEGFRVHTGGWRFKRLHDGSTELINYHGFDLADLEMAERAITLIRQDMQTALNTWAHHGKARLHG